MSSEVLENLGAVRHALSRGDRANALDLLIELRGKSEVVLTYMDHLRAGNVDVVSAWLDRCLARGAAGEADLFAEDQQSGFDLDSMSSDWDLAPIGRSDSNAMNNEETRTDRPLSGKFTLPSPTEIKAKKNRLLEKLSRLKDESESEVDPNKQTRPNVGQDHLDHTMAGMPNVHFEAFGSDPFTSIASQASEVSEFDFDLGFTNPAEKAQPAPEPASEPIEQSEELDFDLGFVSPGIRSNREPVQETRPNQQVTKVKAEQSRSRDYTPVAQLSAVSNDIDDEFFALAESLATEGHDSSYRGEPVVPEEATRTVNRQHGKFTHEEITGLHDRAGSSLVLEDEVVRPQTNLSAILLEARRLYEAGDFAAALEITKKVLSRRDDPGALELRATIEGELERQHLQVIGPLSRTPQIGVSMSDIHTLNIDHRAGFLLSQIDGMMTFEDLVELSGMPRLETLSVLASLIDSGVVRNS